MCIKRRSHEGYDTCYRGWDGVQKRPEIMDSAGFGGVVACSGYVHAWEMARR